MFACYSIAVKSMQKATCHGCGEEFPSRSAVFRHLKETSGQCLSKEEYEGYLQYLQEQDRHKVLLLYGYHGLEGTDAAQKLLKIVQGEDVKPDKINRSYANIGRRTQLVKQDEGTGGVISEVLATRLPSILEPVDNWIDRMNIQLEPEGIYLIGRHEMKGKGGTFNAEIDVTHRRVEYMLPLDFLYCSNIENMSRDEFFDSLPDFTETSEYVSKVGRDYPTLATVKYLFGLKRKMQSLTTQITPMDADEQDASAKKMEREQQSKRPKNEQKSKNGNKPKTNLLKRRRFHNFTPSCMAHEYVAYRRMDRVYHRATIRFDGERRPFLVLSLTGDLFLHGQVCRVIGVFLALARGLVNQDIVECLFDEKYGSLIPTPAAPSMGMIAGEAYYVNWEGKVKAVLSPRIADRFSEGWNDANTIKRYEYWKDLVRERVARAWLTDGFDEDGRLLAEREWTENVLAPWSQRANQQLEEYRQWKQSSLAVSDKSAAEASELIPSLDLVDPTVPAVFEKVLRCLREADASGLWPSTTPKRQMVMISSLTDPNATDEDVLPNSLADAHGKAKNNKGQRSSAYIFAEGEGGASGSFSVGAMPGDRCIQPKGNSLFPELMKAAFELEMALRPDREPSSTIAINRNAQFRPHTDSGAGAGQSTSLIVGLGTYAGGELVVEGEKKDIRYKAVEFNGWTQRHWTMPFKGERFSLVWFTPKGCEGVRGIDLCS